jgi:predicted permease
MQTDLGFEPSNVLRTGVELPAFNYDGASPAIPSFHTRVLDRIGAIPGIDAVGFVNVLPLTGTRTNGAMEVEGKPHNPRGAFTGQSIYRVVGGDYFGAMHIPVAEGRTFGPGDDRASTPVVIVSTAFAQSEWPGQSALGKRVRPVGMDSGDSEPWHTVIGVVGDTRTASVTDRQRPVYYFDYRQRPPFRSYSTSYVTRTGGAASLAPAIQRAIASVDPQVPIEQRSLESLVNDSVADRRFTMIVLGAFAVVALLLAIVGIYAVVSYTVAQRTRELGVRLALGASPGRVRTMVLLSAMRSIVPGLVAGGLLAVAATSAMRSLLYGVTPLDPVALGAAVGILAIAGLASTLGPAIRATRVDPLIAIRAE